MQIEVFERESDAIDGAAEAIAAAIVAAGEGAVVALPGGRLGRALLTTLAGHGELPWASTRWMATDEACGSERPPDSTREVIMGSALSPNRVPARELCVPDPTVGASAAREDWDARVRTLIAARGAIDLIVLTAGADGSVAGLAAGEPATGTVVLGRNDVVSLGEDALAAARKVVLVATGASVEAALMGALTQTIDVVSRPLQRVLPDATRVTWFVDRAAVAGISASLSFPPLPAEFSADEVRLQFVFLYNMKR